MNVVRQMWSELVVNPDSALPLLRAVESLHGWCIILRLELTAHGLRALARRAYIHRHETSRPDRASFDLTLNYATDSIRRISDSISSNRSKINLRATTDTRRIFSRPMCALKRRASSPTSLQLTLRTRPDASFTVASCALVSSSTVISSTNSVIFSPYTLFQRHCQAFYSETF